MLRTAVGFVRSFAPTFKMKDSMVRLTDSTERAHSLKQVAIQFWDT